MQYKNISLIKSIGILIVLIWIPELSNAQKINGISFSGPSEPILELKRIESLQSTNANWIALIPEATLDRSSLKFVPDQYNDNWSETIPGSIAAIKLAKKAGLKVFLKPHIVLGNAPEKKLGYRALQIKYIATDDNKPKKDKTNGAKWRGDFFAKNEMDWKTVESAYENYILELATIAEIHQVDLFAIGTELKQFTSRRSPFWKSLIIKVRAIYKGPITYAANWDEYQKISFWNELDYIGVDSYFPINKSKTPKLKKTLKNWKSVKTKLKELSERENKKILLTEFGYRNVSFSGRQPWLHDKEKSELNNDAQVNLLEAFFQSFWNEPYIGGGFAWKWFYNSKKPNNTTFSFQNKPAAKVIEKWYAKE